MQFPIVLGVSARHAHLSREHMDILFGKDSELHVKKQLVNLVNMHLKNKLLWLLKKAP